MAFFNLEPFGSHYDDLRAGTIASMIANVNRDARARREPFEALDFIAWNDYRQSVTAAEPVLLDDPDEQSKMIDRVLFGRRDG